MFCISMSLGLCMQALGTISLYDGFQGLVLLERDFYLVVLELLNKGIRAVEGVTVDEWASKRERVTS